MIDTHCHLNFDSFDTDRSAVMERAQSVGVGRIINPAVDLSTSQAAIALAHQFEGIFASVGVHPNSTAAWSPEHLGALRDYSDNPAVIAIGEIGLDYYWDRSPRTAQIRAFEDQLALAATLSLPVIIHNRDASEDVIAILETWVSGLKGSLRDCPGVMHSFSGTKETAERALAAGFYLGFTGPITYKNAELTRQIATTVPLDRIVVETDAPFLTPIPYRGKRNEPAYIPLIVERLAAVRSLSVDEVALATTRNAEHLFRMPSAELPAR